MLIWVFEDEFESVLSGVGCNPTRKVSQRSRDVANPLAVGCPVPGYEVSSRARTKKGHGGYSFPGER